MRESFNTTCQVFTGPGTPSPGTLLGTFACRFVREDAILPSNPGVPEMQAYLTIQDYNPRGCFTYPSFGVDASIADRVIVATHPLAEFWVVYSDRIDWYSQAPYFRSYLATVPPPPPSQMGGIILGGAATVLFSHQITVSGGIILGGNATISMSRVVHIDGGIILGGNAVIAFSRVTPVSGGIILGGNAVIAFSRVTPVSGGIILGGAAVWSFTPGGPTHILFDDFSASDGTNISGRYVPSGTATPAQWITDNANFWIQSNAAQINGNIFNSAKNGLMFADALTADVTINVILTIPASGLSGVGIVVRVIDAANYISFSYDIASHSIAWHTWTSSVPVNLSNALLTLTPGSSYNFRVILSGVFLYADIIGVSGSVLTATSSYNISQTKHGLMDYHDGSSYNAVTPYTTFTVD